MTLPYTLTATVEELQNDYVVLVTADQQHWRVPKNLISPKATVGGTVHIAIFSDQDLTAERNRFAKQILNELLRS